MRKDGESVNGPCRTLGVDMGVGQHVHVLIELPEVAVDLLDKVCPILIAAVDASFDGKGFDGIDVRIADDVFQMPLHGVDPAFGIEMIFEAVVGVRIGDGGIDVVFDMIIADDFLENPVVFFCFFHVWNKLVYCRQS